MFTGVDPRALLDPAMDDVTAVLLDRMTAAAEKAQEQDLADWARGKL